MTHVKLRRFREVLPWLLGTLAGTAAWIILTTLQPSKKKQIDRVAPKPLPIAPQQSNKPNGLFEIREAKIDLTMFGGHDDVLSSLVDFVLYLQNPEEYIKEGIAPPKGVLLSGPPGVGKTFVAEAIAGHAGVPIIVVSAASLQDKYVGDTEKHLRDLFNTAKKNAPCVVCVDELDSIGQKRFTSPKNASDVHANSVVNQLLTLLADDNPGVIVIATTNNFSTIDPAVTRPGRFDRHVVIPMPNLEDRLRILTIHTQGKKLAWGVALNDLALLSAGFTGAMLAAWVNEASIRAKRDHSRTITYKHFDQARAIIGSGTLGRIEPNQEIKRRTAIHETGHALIGHLLGQRLHKVSILKTGDTLGKTEFLPDDIGSRSKVTMLNEICLLLAGRAAEQLFGCPQMGSENDFSLAKHYAALMIKDGLGTSLSGINGDLEVETILQEQMQRALTLLKENRQNCEDIITTLVKQNELYREDFLNILAGKKVHSFGYLSSLWSNTSEKKFKLPAKKESRVPNSIATSSPISTVNLIQSSHPLPFTSPEVIRALGIDSDCIRSIEESYGGGCEITFKPSFKMDNSLQEKLKKMLHENSIEHFFSMASLLHSNQQKLIICKNGYNDFIHFVKKHNEPGNEAYPGLNFYW